MFNVNNIRQPFSFATFAKPKLIRYNGESLYERFQQELAKDAEGTHENTPLNTKIPKPPPTASQIEVLTNLLEKNQATIEEYKALASKLASKVVKFCQLEEAEMISCINLDVTINVSTPAWQLQKRMWGTQALENIEEHHMDVHGSKADILNPDSVHLKLILVHLQLPCRCA
jgi:hypothetical protein